MEYLLLLMYKFISITSGYFHDDVRGLSTRVKNVAFTHEKYFTVDYVIRLQTFEVRVDNLNEISEIWHFTNPYKLI